MKEIVELVGREPAVPRVVGQIENRQRPGNARGKVRQVAPPATLREDPARGLGPTVRGGCRGRWFRADHREERQKRNDDQK